MKSLYKNLLNSFLSPAEEGTPALVNVLLLSVVYEDCKVEDVDRAAEKYVKIVFAVNTQSSDTMTYQEFYSLVVIQPQIVNYLQLVDISEEESLYE